jgi:hypothetical protein
MTEYVTGIKLGVLVTSASGSKERREFIGENALVEVKRYTDEEPETLAFVGAYLKERDDFGESREYDLYLEFYKPITEGTEDPKIEFVPYRFDEIETLRGKRIKR